jgi:hypothetical protein
MTTLPGDTLYERQKALVRAGLLEAEGRGPGKGVQTTPRAVALLLIAAVATDKYTETERRTREIASATSEGKLCPLTGAKTFLDALITILSSSKVAIRMHHLVISRIASYAELHGHKKRFEIREPLTESKFYGRSEIDLNYQVLTVIRGGKLHQIATELEARNRLSAN